MAEESCFQTRKLVEYWMDPQMYTMIKTADSFALVYCTVFNFFLVVGESWLLDHNSFPFKCLVPDWLRPSIGHRCKISPQPQVGFMLATTCRCSTRWSRPRPAVSCATATKTAVSGPGPGKKATRTGGKSPAKRVGFYRSNPAMGSSVGLIRSFVGSRPGMCEVDLS